VRKVLGQRGAGRTYLADDVDGLVVLKELSFFTTPDQATLAAFHQEARQLQALTHPRIPRYLDLLQLGTGADTRLYLAQEFIEGTPLKEELSKRRVTELAARELARQVLDILHYLQGRTPPVFHGDLKPANLIRRPDEALFLVDFGAGWVRGGTDAEPSRYTPPDQPTGELDVSTDFYALGVTLVDALTWEPQWKQRAATSEELASHVDVSRSFREFLARLMASERDMRFTSAAEALRELEAPEQALLPPSPLRRLRPVAVGAGAALLIFGAGFVTGRATRPTPLASHEATEGVRPTTPRRKKQPPPPPPAPVIQSQYAISPGKLSVMDTTNTVGAPDQLRQEPATDHHWQPCEYAWFGAASSSGNLPSSTASDAVDRNPNTSWRSPPATEAWLQVDLGRLRTIDSLVLAAAWKTRSGTKEPSTLETSLDNVRWTPLLTMSTEPTYPPVPYRAWFPARAARYVRFVATDWRGGEAVVSTFELYGPDCRLKQAPSRNASDSELSPPNHRP
jgi:serine/threonine protein kinase